MDPHFREEDLHETDQIAQREIEIRDDAFDLVELCEMCCVDRLVAEDTVDREVASGTGVGGEFVEHVGRDGGCVCSEDKLEGLFLPEGVTVADGAIFPVFVDVFDGVPISLVILLGSGVSFGIGYRAIG